MGWVILPGATPAILVRPTKPSSPVPALAPAGIPDVAHLAGIAGGYSGVRLSVALRVCFPRRRSPTNAARGRNPGFALFVSPRSPTGLLQPAVLLLAVRGTVAPACRALQSCCGWGYEATTSWARTINASAFAPVRYAWRLFPFNGSRPGALAKQPSARRLQNGVAASSRPVSRAGMGVQIVKERGL